MHSLLLLFIGGTILTIGDIVMKKWVISNSISLYISAMALYLLGLNFLAFSFKEKDIAIASVIFIIFNVVTLAIAGKVFFGEDLSPLKIVSIAMALTSVVMLEIAG
jgi:multidrug transporter EmrE-like cation transporter